MSRTSRLFGLMDALRLHRRAVTAAHLASQLSVSVRTVYRDIQTLTELGAPIEGEAGVGYVLRPGFFLPPLMFDTDELEALVLGARWVQANGDHALAAGAASALAKIATAAPKDLRDNIADTGLWTPRLDEPADDRALLQAIRAAIRRECKVSIAYTDAGGKRSQRTVWPIGLAFWTGVRVMVAWCEAREGFRSFRADRIARFEPTQARYPSRRSVLLRAWRKEQDLAETS